jgi:hypothetical protein
MSAARHRGQPLAMLGFVLASWIGVRAAVWVPPFALPGLAEVSPPVQSSPEVLRPMTERAGDAHGAAISADLAGASPQLPAMREPWPVLAPPAPALPLATGPGEPLPAAQSPAAQSPAAQTPAADAGPVALDQPRLAAAHQLLYLAALGQLPLPASLALAAAPQQPARPTPPMPATLAQATAPSRWSGDAWLLVRRGSGGLAAAAGFPSYGASQGGGVIRYALAPASAHAPQAYLRISRAIGGFDESELAAGLSARPFAGVPLRLLGEARVQRGAGVTRVRPAASLVSEFPPLRLPLGIAGEAYAQVGYAAAPLGQSHGATPFFDVQAIAERKLASMGPAELRLGGGVWSGGQKGAARLDLGPRASLRLATGPATSRLALDWRFRVAGNASPASGPTLTLSAGF